LLPALTQDADTFVSASLQELWQITYDSEGHVSGTFPGTAHADLVSKSWLMLGALPAC